MFSEQAFSCVPAGAPPWVALGFLAIFRIKAFAESFTVNIWQVFSAMALMALSHTHAAGPANVAVSREKSLRPNIVVILADDI